MRFAIAFAAIFAAALAGRADQPAPNVLTPAEIAEGWILLFDGKTTFGWNVEGDVKIENGDLVLGGPDGAKLTTTTCFGSSTLKFDFQPTRKEAELALDCQFGARFSFLNPFGNRGVGFGFPPFRNNIWPNLWDTATISDVQDKSRNMVRGMEVEQVVRKGDSVNHIGDWTTFPLIGLNAQNPVTFRAFSNESVRLHNIKLKPTALTSLFNGKDLTGWHAYKGPDAKSKFSVTPEGTLHIENGKGDLQTDKQWSDFLLQIECRTNAPALNSGVFFRCQPDKYQQGYEAQVQNSFLPAATKEYVIDRYDPQTHKLISKDKVKYDSYDYGTGAIYRRIPARFKVANDKEWFTMTVLAEGRHMGVWVNGIMVTDWTDNRPDNDNGRNGYKAGPGNISLQGHDPTTNLDFRNIRIVDLAPKK